MAWMRMMGAESVAYHRATVLERGDDFPGQALANYASRGDTPLAWGGLGAAGLGLSGAVTPEGYEAIYGPGGTRHPVTGERLVSARRPGMELVISAHKSVAELGVVGRAEDIERKTATGSARVDRLIPLLTERIRQDPAKAPKWITILGARLFGCQRVSFVRPS